MKKIFAFIVFVCITFCTYEVQSSQLGMLLDRLDTHIANDSSRWLLGKYKGNLKITDVNMTSNNYLEVFGTFNTLTEFGTILTRHYNATLKLVLDDVVIISCCWETAFGTRWCTR